jgi:hypothetical protein
VHWPNGKAEVGSVAWHGGPVVYQAIDIGAETAQGPIGSLTGETDVRVTATNTGLHFSGFTRNGELVVTSVFGDVDRSGRYLAVMSRHGLRSDHESAQVYGSCDTGLSR